MGFGIRGICGIQIAVEANFCWPTVIAIHCTDLVCACTSAGCFSRMTARCIRAFVEFFELVVTLHGAWLSSTVTSGSSEICKRNWSEGCCVFCDLCVTFHE